MIAILVVDRNADDIGVAGFEAGQGDRMGLGIIVKAARPGICALVHIYSDSRGGIRIDVKEPGQRRGARRGESWAGSDGYRGRA